MTHFIDFALICKLAYKNINECKGYDTVEGNKENRRIQPFLVVNPRLGGVASPPFFLLSDILRLLPLVFFTFGVCFIRKPLLLIKYVLQKISSDSISTAESLHRHCYPHINRIVRINIFNQQACRISAILRECAV